MPKPLKLRRINEIVGLFIVLSLAIAMAGVLLGPQTQRWFMPARTLFVRLPPEGSLGLRKGADVQILGSVVGSVEDISVNDSGEMQAEVSIRGNFIRFVRVDSLAIIRKPLGIGDASIEITRGHGDALPLSGALLSSTADKAPTEMLQETLTAFREEALPAVKELRGAINEYTRLATDLRGQQKDVHDAVQHINRIGDSIEHGDGVVSMLLNDPKPVADFRAAVPKLNASLDSLRAILEDSKKVSGHLPSTAANLDEVIKNLKATTDDLAKTTAGLPELAKSTKASVDQIPGLMLQAQETARQIQRLAEALQRNWLIRGEMDQPSAGGRISGDRVGTGR